MLGGKFAGLTGITAGALLVTQVAAQQQGPSGYPELRTGKEVYENVCQACHMPQGEGAVAAAAYPPLAGNKRLRTPLYTAAIVIRGYKSMPAFSSLTDQQIADVTNYVRSNFGNNFEGAATVEQVNKLRPTEVKFEGQRPG